MPQMKSVRESNFLMPLTTSAAVSFPLDRAAWIPFMKIATHLRLRHFVQSRPNGRFAILLGEYCDAPVASAVVASFDEGILWLREQVKPHFPDSPYAKRLLTNWRSLSAVAAR
jgi:hypothetical protein